MSEYSGEGHQDSVRSETAHIREHVVQIEALLSYLLLVMVGLFIVSNLTQAGRLTFLVWMVPACFLVGWRAVLRVTNPTSKVRDRLTWAAAIGGVLGAAGGAAADIASLGLTAGQGTAAGIALGTFVGGAVGPYLEGLGKRDEMLQRGDAFLYLLGHRKRNPKLANAGLVNEALDKLLPSYDINSDGRKWFSRDDLDKFIRA